jgi:hypothetical protein
MPTTTIHAPQAVADYSASRGVPLSALCARLVAQAKPHKLQLACTWYERQRKAQISAIRSYVSHSRGGMI